MSRLILSLYFLLLSFAAQGSNEDIPSKGASYFDYFLDQAGIDYDGSRLPQSPHPFESLLKKLNEYSPFFSAVIPFGRSLQKMAGYPTPLKYPRLLIATRSDKKGLNTHLTGRLFIGYVEPSKKLEVISYNPQMGRFEYQFVNNFYPGGEAQTTYAPRSLCLRCHQGGVPIFAGGDWLEATGFNHELKTLTEEAVGKKEIFGIPIAREGRSSLYEMLPQPERFDDEVMIGASLLAYQKAYRDICGESVECRQEFLVWTLMGNLLNNFSIFPNRDLVKRFVEVLGDGTIDFPSQRIMDHNPVQKGKLSLEFPKEIDPTFPRPPLELIMKSSHNSFGGQNSKFYVFAGAMGRRFFTKQDFQIMQKHLRLDAAKAQQIKLPKTYDGALASLQEVMKSKACYPKLSDLKALLDRKKLKDEVTVQCLGKGFQDFLTKVRAIDLKDPVFNRMHILTELDKALGSKYWQKLCCAPKLKNRFRKSLVKKPYLKAKQIKNPKIKSFFHYCSECHLHQDLPKPFLAGESEAVIASQLKAKENLIQFRLRSKQMPPHFARRPLDHKSRQRLMKSLQEL